MHITEADSPFSRIAYIRINVLGFNSQASMLDDMADVLKDGKDQVSWLSRIETGQRDDIPEKLYRYLRAKRVDDLLINMNFIHYGMLPVLIDTEGLPTEHVAEPMEAYLTNQPAANGHSKDQIIEAQQTTITSLKDQVATQKELIAALKG